MNLRMIFSSFLLNFLLIYGAKGSPKIHDKLVDIFRMEDYSVCMKNGEQTYCTANIEMVPKDPESEYWKEVHEFSKSSGHYNHFVIHRTMCVPKKHDSKAATAYIEDKVNREIEDYNATAKILDINCKIDDKPLNLTDIAIMVSAISYLAFVIFATTFDQRIQQGKVRKWFQAFSLTSNYRLMTSDKNPDFSRLKCVQGVRFYNTNLVIVCHTLLSSAQLYIKNTEKLEEAYAIPGFKSLSVLFSIMVQTYFVISSWLLVNQILEMNKKNGRFCLRDALLLFINRIARFWPSLMVMMFLGGPYVSRYLNGPVTFELANSLKETCRKNWWATLFHVTNFIEPYQVCNLGMWSLSLDTQFYVVTMTLLYLAINYKWNLKKNIAFLLVTVMCVNAVVIYTNDFDPIVWVDLETSKRMHFYYKKNLSMQYFSYYANWGASLVGIFFGNWYYHSKQDPKLLFQNYENLFSALFAIAPAAAVLMGSMEFGRAPAALLGPLLKPTFSFGIGMGIFGMSRNVVRGRFLRWAKSMCENKYVTLLGNFSFSTYVFHFWIVFSKGSGSSALVELDTLPILKSLIKEIALSWIVGIMAALFIEQPGINIKKMLLPQISKKNEELSKIILNAEDNNKNKAN